MSRKGKLKSEHEIAIRDNYIYLQEELEPVSVADYLYEKCVFDKDDLEEIRSGKTRKQKATELIDKIQRAGPHDAYEIFLESLEKYQKHIRYRLIQSTQDWLQNRRCPSPQNIPRDTTENMLRSPLLKELDILNKVIDNLKKENEQLTKENKKLAQSLANEIKERTELAESNCRLKKLNVSEKGQCCCGHCIDACEKIKCIFCDFNVRQRKVMQFESEFDQSLEKILELVSIDPENIVWKDFFVIVACANMEKSLNLLLNQGLDVDLNATLTRNISIFQFHKKCLSPNTRPVEKYGLVEYQYKKQLTALMAAASNGSYRSLKLLLENGADVNATDVLGDTPLIYLCRGMHLGHPLYHTSESFNHSISDLLDTLISAGARIDAKGEDGMTALMHCAKNGNRVFISTLLGKVPDMSIVCNEGKTVLMYECSQRKFYEGVSSIHMIISQNNCDVNARDKNGNTALMHCLLANNVGSFQELYESTVDVNIQNNEGISPLILAVKLNMENVVKDFIKYYSDNDLPLNLNLQDKNGDTALITATKMSTSLAVELMDREEIDVNVQNNIGETALMIAAENFVNNLVERLIAAGANVNIKDNKGRSILNRTRASKDKDYSYQSRDTIQILVDAGAVE